MKTKAITISIPNPCDAKLDEMQTVANGKFCTHCCKTVWDFTNWSEEELGHFFANSEQLVCGRFAALQLSNPLPVPIQNHYGKLAAATIGFSLLFAQDAVAQHKTPLKPKQNIVAQKKIKIHKMIGFVQDEDGNKIPSIAIQLMLNDSLLEKVFTDRMGCFEVAIPYQVLHDSTLKISIQSERYSPFQISLSDFDWKQSNMISVNLVKPTIFKKVERVSHTAGVPKMAGGLQREIIYIESKSSKNSPNKTYDAEEIERRGLDNILKDIH